MDLKTAFPLVIFLIIGFSSLAQDSIRQIKYDDETEYKHTFPNRITARLFYINTSNLLRINDRNSDLFYDLEPNKQDNIGVSLAFRSISISYALTPNFLAKNKDNENSKLFNLQLRNYFNKHWMQTLELHSAKGFYIKNNITNAYFPEIKSFKIGGATSYIFNENFSFKAIVSQDEKQLKSVGSFIPRIVYYYTKYHLKNDDTNTKIYSYDMLFAPSYYYNFVPTKNLFLSLGISTGIGLNYSKDDTENLTSLSSEFNFRGSTTYDINDFYLGAHYNYLILNHNTDRSTFVNDGIPFFEIFLGYRFKAPEKLVYKADSVNEKIKLKK